MEWKILADNTEVCKFINDEEDDEEEEDEEDDEFGDDEDDDDDEDEDEDYAALEEVDSLFARNGNRELTLRLTLGKKESNNYHCYETKHSYEAKVKDTKNELATIVLNDIMGPDYIKTSNMMFAANVSSVYDWEIQHPIKSDCELYLAGLIWTLHTYQDGVCSDYAYNYGKRSSPYAEQIIDYFKSAIDEDRQVGKKELLGTNFTYPMKNGVSCLAALPSQLNDLIAEPYSKIAGTRVEKLYRECVSSVDNAFDIQKFKDLCEAEIAPLIKSSAKKKAKKKEAKRKIVQLGEDFWTVVFRNSNLKVKPFQPPKPVLDRFQSLFVNPRIKAGRFNAASRPKEREAWIENLDNKNKTLVLNEIDFCDIDMLLAIRKGRDSTISHVPYFTPYAEILTKQSKKKEAKKQRETKPTKKNEHANESNPKEKSVTKRKVISNMDLENRIKEFKLDMDPSIHPEESIHGETAISQLMFLVDFNMINIEWRSSTPSPTKFAEIDPAGFESMELIIRKGDVPLDAKFGKSVTFQRDREITRGSKKQTRQYLASLALTKILRHKDKKWYEMTHKEMKSLLTPER